jgi:hypothetical protein
LATLVTDDGTTLDTNDSGEVLSATDSGGAAVAITPADGGSISQAFANLVTWGVQGVIGARPAASLPKPGVQPAPTVAAQAGALLASPMVKIVGLGLLGFLLYKKFA